MASGKYFLSLDQGGHSSRALIFDAQGNVVSQAQQSVSVSVDGDHVEQSPDEIVASLKQVATQAINQLPADKRINLQSAALVCQRSSVAFWRASSGAAIAPIVSWQDTRGRDMLSNVLATNISGDALKQLTGLVANAHYGASKIKWMLRHDERVAQARLQNDLRCGPLSAFLVRALTNNRHDIVDASNACRTQLVSLQTLDWDAGALSAFAIDRELLPTIVPSLADYGMLVLQDVALPLRYVNGDQNAALFANGTVDLHAAYISVGTGAFCLSPWSCASVPPERLLTTLIARLQSPLFAIEGTVNGAASALDWLDARLGAHHAPDVISRWLDTIEPAAIFINAVNGLASPFWRTDVESRFIALGDRAPDDAECYASVIESVVFALCLNLTAIRRAGMMVRRIHIAGGLSRHDGLCQRIADIAGLPVIRSDDAEASARGAAFWLANCPNTWAGHLESKTFAPRDNKNLIGRYDAWCNAMQQYLPQDQM